MFKVGEDEDGREFYLNGQPAKNWKLIFTASNGFFEHGACVAMGESKLPKVGDEKLIRPNFAYLGRWKRTGRKIRWHVWIAKPGKVRFNVHMQVAAAGSQVAIAFAGQSRTVVTVAAEPTVTQPWDLVFEAAKPGEHTFAVSAMEIAGKGGVGELHRVDAYGPAFEGAQLLRARWRPAAVHGGYTCSKLKVSRMWVMTTRSVCDSPSYSPITTPFGYYGTAFGADRRSNGGFNFSMWASGRKGKIPPLERMPHLLAAGSPNAEFGGFGHEGSGVKIRGSWVPMPDRPKLCVQALRVEPDGKYNTFHGYFWDHPSRRWKLYAVGRKWSAGKPISRLYPGSFCEIPGPPHMQRTGDLVREVRRRGWFMGDDGKWYAMDKFRCRGRGIANKFWHITPEGEFAMGTGGMRHYKFTPPPEFTAPVVPPEFLSPEATRQLYRLPVEFGNVQPTKVAKTTVTLDIAMVRLGSDARARVYYGTADCLTFAKRKLHATERRSKVSKSTQAVDRSWAHEAEITSLRDGSNHVVLKGLEPGTTYYYRVLVTNNESRMWTFETRRFKTGA